mmetsp:Transcript_13725/g.28698  ORF Transcript_13725/g.28698 Transcript_13725/m.28698 type:complete len:241 (-) Transcript_13725:102-824(-)
MHSTPYSSMRSLTSSMNFASKVLPSTSSLNICRFAPVRHMSNFFFFRFGRLLGRSRRAPVSSCVSASGVPGIVQKGCNVSGKLISLSLPSGVWQSPSAPLSTALAATPRRLGSVPSILWLLRMESVKLAMLGLTCLRRKRSMMCLENSSAPVVLVRKWSTNVRFPLYFSLASSMPSERTHRVRWSSQKLYKPISPEPTSITRKCSNGDSFTWKREICGNFFSNASILEVASSNNFVESNA